MGCLKITLSAVEESIKPSLTAVSEGIKATLSGFEGLRCTLQYEPPLAVSLKGIGESLKVSISEVCSTPQDFYLEVSPKVMWLTPDNNFTDNFEVKSNLKWTIE